MIDKFTLTTVMLIPRFGYPYKLLSSHGFVNGFVGDHGQEVQHDNCIYLLFDLAVGARYSDIEVKLKADPLYIQQYTILPFQVMNVLKMPEDLIKVYTYFKRGEYSRFPINFVKKYFASTSSAYKICMKDTAHKKHWEVKIGEDLSEDSEVWSRPQQEDEIYRFNPKLKNVTHGKWNGH